MGKLDDILQPDLPVHLNPLYQKEIQLAKLYRLSDIAGVPQVSFDKALQKELNLNNIIDSKLTSLVKEKVISSKEATDIGYTSNLYTLFDSDFELTEHFKKNIPAQSLSELIKLDKNDWLKIITDSKLELPSGLSQVDYAEILHKKIEHLFPSESLAYRLNKTNAVDLTKGINSLKTLFDKNENPFSGKRFDDLHTENIPAPELSKLKTQFENIQRLSNLHAGLKLQDILNDKSATSTDKAKRISGRIALFEKFTRNNSAINFLELNYTHDNTEQTVLNFQGFKQDEIKPVIDSLKTYQRVYSITKDVEHTESLLAAGFHSAYQISGTNFNDFVKSTKLSTEQASKYFENAHAAIIRTSNAIGTILDHSIGSFDWTDVGNSNPNIKDYLKEIPGYQDLFGKLSFCECEHCQSIFSPAAYYVDLMQFIDKYVNQKYFKGAKANHPLHLKTRRPDLWTLPLTCENTSGLISFLDIVNEILESYIAKNKGFNGDLNDRNALEQFVYKSELALEKGNNWKSFINAFQEPFHLALESVSVYLSHFEKTREQIATLLQKPASEISKAKLNFSEKEFQLITNPDATPAFIQRLYDINFTIQSGKITPIDVTLLIKSTSASRDELERIFKTDFVSNYGTDKIQILAEKLNTESIQNDIERIKNLSFETLDRLHRFLRLLRKTNWNIEELDLALNQLNNSSSTPNINETIITQLGILSGIQSKLGIPLETCSAICFAIPTKPTLEGGNSLIDVLFNPADIISSNGAYPKDLTRLILPSLIIDKSTPTAEYTPIRLMMGLHLSEVDLTQLIIRLAKPLGIIDLQSTSENKRGFLLNLNNLSLLFRHAQLAELLHVSIDELFKLISLSPDIPNGHLESLSHVNALIKLNVWYQSGSCTLDQLLFIIGKNADPSAVGLKNKEELSNLIIQRVQNSNALTFADTLFAYLADINEEQSKAIIAANNQLIELSPDGIHFWLTSAFNPNSQLTIPAGITRPETEIRELLYDFHPRFIIPHFLGEQISLTEGIITKALSALNIDLNKNQLVLELQGNTSSTPELSAIIEKIFPLCILFNNAGNHSLSEEQTSFILAHLSNFEISDLSKIHLNHIQNIQDYLSLISTEPDAALRLEVLNAVLVSFEANSQFKLADQEKLSFLLKTDPAQLASIHLIAAKNNNSIAALNHYQQLIACSQYIGIGANALPKIVSLHYDELHEASESLLAAFRSKYRNEEDRNAKLEPYQNKLRSKKRTALRTVLNHSGFPEFENEADLYHYFLIDTEMEACTKTSRLVAATMSLQLYIQRVMLNLEQDAMDSGTVGKLQVRATDIPEDEWEWRKNYRVWEANRKIFLYPENYIEPELRDDKSELFEDLEKELLQQNINADTVLDAYAKYMRAFDEIAHLKIAGSYLEKDEDSETDALHLFGVSSDEPPSYYYRRVENIHYSEINEHRGVVWEPWKKITVQIPVRKVAPITYNGRLYVFWVRHTTLTNSIFDENQSVFTGYTHKFFIEFTSLKLDGSWTPPQRLDLQNTFPFTGNGVLQNPLADGREIKALVDQLHEILRSAPFFDMSQLNDEILALKTPRYDIKPHFEPVDEYSLDGFLWDQVYPSIASGKLVLTGAAFQMHAPVDLYNLAVSRQRGIQTDGRERLTITTRRQPRSILLEENTLYNATSPHQQIFDSYAYCTLIVNTTKSDSLLNNHWSESTLDACFDRIKHDEIATLPARSKIQIINGAYGDAIIDIKGDLFLLQGSPTNGNEISLKRLGTTLSETLTRTLFTSGVDTMLNITTQKALKEMQSPISITGDHIKNLVVENKIDYKGAYGNYYREIFFHIPFLIANYLNSQGKYADAQKWYHYIFNPSANEVINLADSNLTSAQIKKMGRRARTSPASGRGSAATTGPRRAASASAPSSKRTCAGTSAACCRRSRCPCS